MKRVTKSINEALSLEYDSSMYKNKYFFSFFKRLFDIVSSFVALIILSPLFLILIILVKIDSKGPAFYGHYRVGKNGKKIKIYKFRSMKIDNRPLEEILTKEQLEEYKTEYKVTNDPRVTRIGKILRKTSLDEIPQLLNILKGDMSIVGWRPIIFDELNKYSPKERELLLKVRPGLTGYWSSHGRSDVEYSKRIKMELYYVYKRSFWLDVRILYHTVVGVIETEGAV